MQETAGALNKIPVAVTVRSQQRQKSGERQNYTLEAEGALYQKGEALYLVYKEQKDSGLGATSTTIRVEGKTLTLIRHGETTMRQVLVKGAEQHGSYNTPYGTFDVTTRTQKLVLLLNSQGGRIEALYNIRLAGEKSRIELQIEVHPL